MRIVTWNMGSASGYSPSDAWEFLFADLEPHIALIQETVVPDEIPEDYEEPLWTKTWPNSDWGSIILSRVGKLALSYEDTRDNRAQIAHGILAGIGPTCVSNIHSRTDPVFPRLTGTIETVMKHRGDRFIVGGDFNVGRIAPVSWTQNTEFWGKIDGEWGFKEPLPFGLGERQSFWREWTNGVEPTAGNSMQDDHILLDAETFEAKPMCLVWDTKRVRELSDHGPVVVDLDLPA